jgi:hypothetical protein
MAVLRIKVTTTKMPHTSELFGVVKAVEHFYYALLFSNGISYSGRPEPWRSWVEQGFSAAIRHPPPETGDGDELVTSVRSDGKIIEITASSPNDGVLDKLAHLLAAVDAHRLAITGQRQGTSPSNEIREQLLEPVSERLGSSGVDSRVSHAVTEMLSVGLRSLTYRDVKSIEVSSRVGTG